MKRFLPWAGMLSVAAILQKFSGFKIGCESTDLTSTIGGDDIDLPPDKKDKLEARLRREAREMFRKGNKRERDRKLARAKEISRRKSKRAHQN